MRSTLHSNPLGVTHPVLLTTWIDNAILDVGDDFAMTGGTLCVAKHIQIGNCVTIGANSVVVNTDFYPLNPRFRRQHPQDAQTAPVFIEDDVFIGMNCLISKGVHLGRGKC